MTGDEVGRWPCAKCGRELVAAGHPSPESHGFDALVGPCPWNCGARITRGFRWMRPGTVHVYRAEAWDAERRTAT